MTANKGTPQAGENVSEEQSNEEAELVDIGSADAWGSVEIPEEAGDCTVDVQAERLDGEPSQVNLTARVDGAGVTISLDVDDAEGLAAKISSAAAFAGGDGQ